MKHITTAVVSVVTALVVTLGVWFAPTHGQPNEDLAQLVDVTVIDDRGNAVPGASISLQRMSGRDATNVARGGATNAAGERSIEMPVRQGRYRVVMTVPQGYSADRDDADGHQPGPNGECAGMVRRCVLLDVDAAGQVSITTPRHGADATAITFHVRRDVVPMLLSVTQKDVAGTPVHGGTFVMRSYEIVEVNGRNVRRYGRTSRTGMTTSARTFRVQPNTSYVISWEPPQGYLRHAPVAPSQYEITTGASGTITKDFVVRRPAAPGDGVDQRRTSTGSSGSSGVGSPNVTPPQRNGTRERPQPQPQQPTPAPRSEAPSGSTGAVVPQPEPRTDEPAVDDTSVPAPTIPVATPEVPIDEPTAQVEIDQDPTEGGVDAELDPELAAEIEAERADAAGADVSTRVEVDGGFADLGTATVDIELGGELAAEVSGEIAG